MKNLSIKICILLLFPLFSFGQGIIFREITFQEALKMAKEEKKTVFIDFYTTWCGPCKQMSRTVFTQKEIGDYFNKHFISLKCNAEEKEGRELAQKYGVEAYPTFVFIDDEGKICYRFAGAMSAENFLARVQRGLDPELTPERLAVRYQQGERTPQLIMNYALVLLESGQDSSAYAMIDDYFAHLSDRQRIKEPNFAIYEKYIQNPSHPIADYVYQHQEKFIRNVGRERVQKLLRQWLWQETIPYIIARQTPGNSLLNPSDFQVLKEKIEHSGLAVGSYPALLRLGEYKLQENWNSYLEYCQEQFSTFSDSERFLLLVNLEPFSSQADSLREKAIDLIEENQDQLPESQKTPLRYVLMKLKKQKEFRLQINFNTLEEGKVIISGFKGREYVCDTFAFRQHHLSLHLPLQDTTQASLRLFCDSLKTPTAKLGNYYPSFNLMLVPGGFATLSVQAEKGKVPRVTCIQGDAVSKDFIRLEHELQEADEKAYNQLMIDNIVRGGDIRDYPEELQKHLKAIQRKTMAFIRENPSSYISEIRLVKHYDWFDENEIEAIFKQMSPALQENRYGQVLLRRLEAGRPYRIGATAAEFSKKELQGKTVSLKDWQGKYVLLDFWGSWCGPCRASHPHLKELHRQYGDRIIFVGIAQEEGKNLEKARQTWKKAIQDDGLTWIQILNNEDKEQYDLVQLYHVTSFPTKILIDPQGKIAARWSGSQAEPEKDLQKIFNEL